MGFDVVVFKEFKVKPVRQPNGNYRLHVIPLDVEIHNWSYIGHAIFDALLIERYGKSVVDPWGSNTICLHRHYADDLTLKDLKEPSWYLQFFNENFREWIRKNGETLYDKLVHDKEKWAEKTVEGWVNSWCKSVSRLENLYREGKHVVYTNMGVRDALDWWLFEEAEAIGMDDDCLWELKAKDPEFVKWWSETKDKIYSQRKKWWLVTLEELGVKIPERFKWKGEEEFTFNVEAVLEELAGDLDWSEKIEAYKMYKRGMFQDDIKKYFGVTQSAISKWISKVQGELSRRMGNEYELYRKAKLLSREDVERVVHDGRKGKPDFIVYLSDGSVEVISSKCYYSDRKSVSIKRAEIEPEIQEALRLRAQGRRVRLFVDFYNLHDKHHELREIPLDKIPPRLLFQHT